MSTKKGPALLRQIAPFFGGFVFALGLGIAGMTLPSKILSFLDLFGDWDPTLVFVMVGAIAVHSVFYRMTLKLSSPLFETRFLIPTRKDLDWKLISGSLLFGIGWGVTGFCPAPALTSLLSMRLEPVIFMVTLGFGMWAYKVLENKISKF